MPFDKVANVNWLAVTVAAVVVFMLGGLWYTALFGKLWQRLSGYSPERMQALQKRTPPPLFFGGMVVCYFVMSAVIAFLLVALDLRAPGPGAALASVLWLIVAGAMMTNHIASDKPLGVYVIDAGFLLIALPIAGAILGAWR